MAGESAQAVAERQRERADRLVESAARWERGAVGENATAAVLKEVEAQGWTVLHDVRWPGRRYANIDHIVIGNGQVYVIDSKNWAGSVTATGGKLRQNGRDRQRQVIGVGEAAKAVAALAPMLPPTTVHPVLCLVRDEWVNARFGDVQVCSTLNLVAVLQGPPERGPDYRHNDLVRQLEEALRSAAAPPEPVPLKRAEVKRDEVKTEKPSRPKRVRTWNLRKQARRTASATVLGLVVASAVYFNPGGVVTGVSGSIADTFVGVFLPGGDDTPPADDSQKDKSKKQGKKKGQKAKQRQQQTQQQ
jgi:hypothetical protein